MNNLNLSLLSLLALSVTTFASAQELTEDKQLTDESVSVVAPDKSTNKTFWQNLTEIFTGQEEKAKDADDVTTTTEADDETLQADTQEGSELGLKENKEYGGLETASDNGNFLTDAWEKTKKGAQDLFEGTKKAFTGDNSKDADTAATIDDETAIGTNDNF